MSKELEATNSEQTGDMRRLSDIELQVVIGGESINPLTNTGCIRITWGPGPTYNPWLDPYSPERRLV